jgi:hypothetical protein
MKMNGSENETTALNWRVWDGRKHGRLADISDYIEYYRIITSLVDEELISHAKSERLLDMDAFEDKITEPENEVKVGFSTVNSIGASVLDEAKDTISNRGNDDYGNAERCMSNISEQWNLYLSQTHGSLAVITADDVCKMMVLLKIARDSHKPKRDNLVDIIGYTALAQEIRDEKND